MSRLLQKRGHQWIRVSPPVDRGAALKHILISRGNFSGKGKTVPQRNILREHPADFSVEALTQVYYIDTHNDVWMIWVEKANV